MQTIDAFCHRLASYLPHAQVQQVRRAYYYSEQAHDGQTRRSGEPYVTHPLAVAGILAEQKLDHHSLIAALLHDVIEDTGISKTALAEQFGDTVADLVDGVSKLTQIEFTSKAEAQAENFQKMAMAMTKDIRVIIVKLADRLHNMRTLGVLKPEKRRRIARETLEIYAPIANRLGMNSLRMEFQNLGFHAMYPMRAARIAAAVRAARGHRKEVVNKIEENIKRCLAQEGHVAEVSGREKNLYGIYMKMRSKHKSFADIMDVYAFRIVVDSVDTCYRVLGVMHSLYKPIHSEFRDYIAIPKTNGYQSLHTVLIGMHGLPIEVQIRTREMDVVAESGIASHWLYKSEDEVRPPAGAVRAREWIRNLLEIQKSTGNSLEFIEHVKIDLFPDEVYVFTPTGKIIELPVGATAVDFAYAVHTDIGNACVACRINRQLAPLSQPLESGQVVAIVTAPGAQPNPAWLNFVTTGKARSAIRHFLKTQRHTESIDLGRRLLEKALLGMGQGVEQLAPEKIQEFIQQAGVESFDDILESIGLGNRVAYVVAKRLVAEEQQAENSKQMRRAQAPLMIDVADGAVISFARCCRPIPGDPIIAHISAGRGLVVHTDTCKNIAEMRDNAEKCLMVNWSPDVSGEFIVDVRVEVNNERGIIAQLATRITDMEANIDKIALDEKDAGFRVITLSIAVRNRLHLANIMRKIRTLPSVVRTVRVKN
ncbi:MAG: bifunctional GTP diphosphokinase/guanosine-3',5'-bis pyrophosphate 3'-pyrophosphohydrolase [Cellvibrionales bacterium]|nr:bifunctional GTP diphosphokinase/guanosine-3',5'-bis pyrophosphate 3'-pyrophosphohydrolase [Cellvibrionales bacterium]TXH52265.1 MAG: bifunctional GTP diphosphokinase/guanosine-3',5'-bis pyrophosphate 3'-pyrophosphohydrolase [Cellvibrionales bacterium]